MFFILYLEILVHVLICLFQAKDWWSYEFCYGKYIRQFHVEGKVKRSYIQ
jgi:protein OS-9